MTTTPATVFATPWFSVETVPAGQGAPFHRVVAADGVMAMVLTKAGEVVLVRQQRPAIAAETLEFPAGGVDDGETPEQAIIREVAEETGHRCPAPLRLGAAHLCPNRMSNRETFFLAIDAEPIPDHRPEPGVGIVVVPRPVLRTLILKGGFVQAPGLALIALADLRLGLRVLEATPTALARAVAAAS